MKKLILPLCLLAFQGISLQAQNNWPMVSGGSSRTAFVSAGTQLVPPLVLDKTIPVVTENILYYEGILYLSSGDAAGTSAINSETGQVIWNFAVPGAAGSAGVVPAISGDRIFLGAQHGTGLFALNRLTGVQLWMRPFGSLYSRCPVTDGNGHVLICSDSLYCLDEATGRTLWSSAEKNTGTPSITGQTVLVSTPSSLTALKLSTGEILWKAQRQQNALRMQILVDSSGVYESGYGGVVAYRLADGSKRWNFPLPEAAEEADFTEGNAVLAESVLVLVIWNDGSGKSKLVALRKSDGTVAWEYTDKTTGISPPTANNGVVYVTGLLRNWMRGLSLDSGALLYEDTTLSFSSQPVIANQRLFVATGNGTGVFRSESAGIPVTEMSVQQLSPFPNPFRDVILIRQPNGAPILEEIILFTAAGQPVIRETHLKGTDLRLNTAGLSAGVYLLSVKTDRDRSIFRMIRIDDR